MKIIIFAVIFAVSLMSTSFAQQSPACDYKVEILINNSEFESRDFSWRMKATKIEGVPTNITGTAEIEDSKGQIMKRYRPWTNESISSQKTSNTYSPNLNQGEYKIISSIDIECSDINKDNNNDVKIIKIKNSSKKTNTTNIQNSSRSAIIDAKLSNAAKNETYDKAITAQKIENKTASKNEPELIQSEEDNVIQLINNHGGTNTNKITKGYLQKQEIVYESSSEKARGMIVAFLLALSVLLNIVLIWRR